MTGLIIAVRFLHLAASLLPLGIFAFVCMVGRPAAEKSGANARVKFDDFEQTLWRMLAWSLLLVFVTSLIGFVLQALVMTGLSAAQSLTPEIFVTVLATQYGKVWLARQGFLAALAAVTFLLIRENRHPRLWRNAGFALAAGLVACIALTGHAAAGEGIALILQLASDALHLLAAGIWLGALLPLALLLDLCRRAETPWAAAVAKEATRRFSILGLTTVGTLLITGLYNAWQLVGDIAPLVGTDYGRLLLGKLGLLLPLLALAAANLLVIRPRMLAMSSSNGGFRRLTGQLRRNALLEAGIGAAILVIVATLGVTAPARHVQPNGRSTSATVGRSTKSFPKNVFPSSSAGLFQNSGFLFWPAPDWRRLRSFLSAIASCAGAIALPHSASA